MAKRLTVNDVARIVDSANTNVEILKAAGNGAKKRELKIRGDYKRYLEAATVQVVENAVLLAVAMESMGPFTRARFERRVREVDRDAERAKESACQT